MFLGCLQDFSRIFSGCSDGSCGPGGIWWSFQMKVWTLMIQRISLIPSYLTIPAIQWSPAIRWSPAILWSRLFYDPSYSMIPAILWSQLFYDQLEVWTLIIQKSTVIPSSPMVLFQLSNCQYLNNKIKVLSLTLENKSVLSVSSLSPRELCYCQSLIWNNSCTWLCLFDLGKQNSALHLLTLSTGTTDLGRRRLMCSPALPFQ